MIQIPNKQQPEWRELVSGNLNISLTNFFLRTKVNQIIQDTSKMQLSIEEAVETVYNTCVELTKTRNISADIKAIFGDIEEYVAKPKPQVLETPLSIQTKDSEQHRSILPQQQNTEEKKKSNTLDLKKEALRKASIERRNKERQEALEREKKAKKISFFKSLFKQ